MPALQCRDCGIRQIKRNIAIPARAIGDDRPYKFVLFPVDVSDKFTFGTHPTEWALHATPIQNRISITTLNPQFTAVKFKVNVYRKSAESCEHLSENKPVL